MTNKASILRNALGVGMIAWAVTLAAPAARATPAPDRDDFNRSDFRRFDRYLDRHPEVRVELYRNPGLIDDEGWCERQRDLRGFLRKNPGVREEIRLHPQQFTERERRFDRRSDRRDGRRGDDDRPDRY